MCIRDSSLWYLINQYEWYHQTGDIDFLKKHSDYISGLIPVSYTHLDVYKRQLMNTPSVVVAVTKLRKLSSLLVT